ncbi:MULTISPECIES: hormogonium polysaccharide secretion pseudopilin HpsC [unclassified Nostoc]|uniref:hormogonium polysaccharide secretion pseudopilin HpsC n=1 Tax=unclassified Nostoc TaxID=2593658 RepID=UPI0015894930|nr:MULTISPECIES: hormogonium polysaccharide secretion pseudopilin HpsC [unclassified Nostoc]
MVSTLKFLIKSQLKRSRLVQQVNGFTMIELLIAMILAFLIITPLLGFMVNIMDTDRKEQVKANSEQEIQTALDYISRDLQQAIYLYDADGIEAIKNQLPNSSATDRVPVLVFWKRELVNQALTITGTEKDDTFVYSLVAYYLIKDATSSSTWSNAARIARWQIKDGVPASTGVDCTGYTGKYISGNCPSPGFTLFKLDGVGTINDKMNAWVKATETYTADTTVLVDFIDQTKTDDTTPAPAATCPTDNNTWQKVSPNTASFNTRNAGKMTGFYACIDRVNTTAQVFLRGNALARLQSNNLNYTDTNKTYFPNASMRVQGRGYLFTK